MEGGGCDADQLIIPYFHVIIVCLLLLKCSTLVQQDTVTHPSLIPSLPSYFRHNAKSARYVEKAGKTGHWYVILMGSK